MGGNIIDIGNGKLMVHDWIDSLPSFMKEADLVFSDPPWNLGNVTSFYTKASKEYRVFDFEEYYPIFFKRIKQINPKVCYVEVGKQYLAEFIIEMKKIYPKVTFYNSMYYNNPQNKCYIIRGSYKKSKLPKSLDYMDEEKIIEWICKNEDLETIGDICMGQGLVAKYAQRYGKKFVGTELNEKRLNTAIQRVKKEIK